MAEQSSYSIPFVSQLISSNWWPILLPLGYGIFRFVEYLLKRKVEGAGESRDMDALHKALDLREKLARQNMSLDDLKAFRNQALGKSAQTAADTAEHYIARAQYLANATEENSRAEWPEAQTQADMNMQAAAQFTMAEDELTSLVIETMAGLGPEDAEAFQHVQDSWHAWRAAEAEWESKMWEGGSIRPLMVSTKLEQLTRERIAALHVAWDLEREPENIPIVYKATPRDLFVHIEPNTTSQRVRDVIGAPHYISGNVWYYRFKELQLQISIEDEVVDEVAAAFVEGESCVCVLEHEPLQFGKLTFGDLLELDPQLEIQHRGGARTAEIYAHMRIGTPSVYSDYFFGAIDHLHGSGRLLYTEFEWNHDRGLISDPKTVLVNWVACVRTTLDVPAPSWYIK